MADFTPKKIDDISQLNKGKEYVNGVDVVDADDLNKVIESQLYTQGLAVNPPDDTEADNVGTPSVELVTAPDGSARMKFKNLKGAQGVSVSNIDVKYRVTDSGTDIPDYVGSPTIPTVKQGQWLWSKITYVLTNDLSITGYINSRNPYDALIYKPFFFDGVVTGNMEFQLADFNRNVVVGDRFLIYQYNSAAPDERQGTLYLMEIMRILDTVCFAVRVGDGKPVAPVITATATVDNTFSETPKVVVSNEGSLLDPQFKFDFTGLRGKTGTQISQIVDGGPYIAGSYTVTPITVAYTNNTNAPTEFNVYAKQGDPATLVSYNISYANSTSGTTPPQSGYTTSPSPIKGQYLWTRVTTTFNTGDPVISYSVTYVGTDGDTSKFVTTDTDQKIDGYKRFVDGINIGIFQEDGGILDQNSIKFAGDVAEDYISLYAQVSEINDSYSVKIPAKTGTIALTSDIPQVREWALAANKPTYTAGEVKALPISGGTLTGKLTVGSAQIKTNGYIEGTRLRTYQNSNLNTTSTKVAVLNADGWIYYRSPAEIVADGGIGHLFSHRVTIKTSNGSKAASAIVVTKTATPINNYATLYGYIGTAVLSGIQFNDWGAISCVTDSNGVFWRNIKYSTSQIALVDDAIYQLQ